MTIKDAKFGDKFLTTEGKTALFLRFSCNAENEFAFFYIEDWGQVQVFKVNGKEVHGDAEHSIVCQSTFVPMKNKKIDESEITASITIIGILMLFVILFWKYVLSI